MSHRQNYYRASIAEPPEFAALDKNLDVDTLVIGGGYAGLMTQLGLLERGSQSVALIEAKQIGYGASGRNGGFVFGGYSLSPRAIAKQVGLNRAKELYQLTQNAVELIRKRVHTFDIDCELNEAGVIWANWFKDQQLLLAQQKFMDEAMATKWQYLEPGALKQIVCSDRYHGGLFEPNAMHFQPLKYALGVASQIAKLGGLLFENTPALRIEQDGQGHRVVCERGMITAKHVVICAGGYISQFFPKIAQAVLPIATYVMATEPAPDLSHQVLKTRAAIYDTRFAFDYYRPLNDGRMLWGGRISAATTTPAKVAQLLRRDMLKVFPQLAPVDVEFAWGGLMGYCRHQMPLIGRLNQGIWYNLGFGGHGVGPTTVGGELIAAAIAEDDQRYHWFEPWQPDWAGGMFGPAVAQASYWWYQFKDNWKDYWE